MLYVIDKSILNISVTCTLGQEKIVNYNENLIKVNWINFIAVAVAVEWM